MPAVPMLKPWSVMTPQEQAEHLVYDHGFDADFFGVTEPLVEALPDNAAVVRAYVEPLIDDETSEGESYPHPQGRNGWHEGEHSTVESPGDYVYGGGSSHKHGPDSTLARVPYPNRIHLED